MREFPWSRKATKRERRSCLMPMAEAEAEFCSRRNTKDHWRKEIDLSEKTYRGILIVEKDLMY